MDEKFICGDCKRSFEINDVKRGSALIEWLLWLTLVIPAPFYAIWRRRKPKKKCDYCGSDFILPDTLQNREFLKPLTKKNS